MNPDSLSHREVNDQREVSERVFAATARQHQGEAIGSVFGRISDYVGWSRRAPSASRQVKLNRYYSRSIEDYSMDDQMQMAENTLIVFTSFLLAILGYISVALVGTWVFDIGWLRARYFSSL